MPGGPSSTLGSGPPSHFIGVQYATLRLLKRSNNRVAPEPNASFIV